MVGGACRRRLSGMVGGACRRRLSGMVGGACRRRLSDRRGKVWALSSVVKLNVVLQTRLQGTMAFRADQTNPTAAELADLSALADGTLDPARRARRRGAHRRLAGVDRAIRARAPGGAGAAPRAGDRARPPAAAREDRGISPQRRGKGPPALCLRRRCGRGARRRGARAGAGASVGNARRAVGVRRGGTGRSRSSPGGPRARYRHARRAAPAERRRRLLPQLDLAVRMEGRRVPHRQARRAHRCHRLLQIGRTSRSPTRSCIRRRCPSRRRRRRTGTAPSCGRSR